MSDPFVISLNTIYRSRIARDATFSAIPSATLRVVDKTLGDEIYPLKPGVGVSTIVPACRVRRAELTDNGITELAALAGTTVTFNEVTWIITNYKPVPAPGGEATGEVSLSLRASI